MPTFRLFANQLHSTSHTHRITTPVPRATPMVRRLKGERPMEHATMPTSELTELEREAAEAALHAAQARTRFEAARGARAEVQERLRPLLDERDALRAELDTLNLEIREYLLECIAGGRKFYDRMVSITARWKTNGEKRKAIDNASVT